MDAALAIAMWFSIVRPPVFVPADITRLVEAHERERGRIRAAIALSPALSPAAASERALKLSEVGGSISGLPVVNGKVVRNGTLGK
jgi:hypothetical protein